MNKKNRLISFIAYIIFVFVMVDLLLLAGIGCAALMDALLGFMWG